jgi:hypothetical protein
MQQFGQSCFLALSLSILFTSILFAQNNSPTGQRWEYQTVHCDNLELGKLGDEGWELVGVNHDSGSCRGYILKRLKPLAAPRFIDPRERPNPKPTAIAPTCNLTMAQAPAIRGIGLGMTVDELLQLFPGADPNTIKAEIEKAKSEPSFGVATLHLNSSQHRDREQGLGFQLVLFDGRVVSVTSAYYMNNHTQYGMVFTLEQFIDKIAPTYQLPAKENWVRDENRPDHRAVLRCKEVEFQVFSSNLNFIILDPSYLEKQQQRKTEALAKKRAEFKP